MEKCRFQYCIADAEENGLCINHQVESLLSKREMEKACEELNWEIVFPNITLNGQEAVRVEGILLTMGQAAHWLAAGVLPEEDEELNPFRL